MAGNFALPVAVTLDRADQGPLDLTPMLEPGSLSWSSVVPGGFASAGFQINGDFRRLIKLLPYLSIVRIVGDSGRVLFEGQIEDLQPTLSGDTVGIKVGAFGLQNALKEQSVRAVWSSRDLWNVTSPTNIAPGGALFSGVTRANPGILDVGEGQLVAPGVGTSGQQGIFLIGTGVSVTSLTGEGVDIVVPLGLGITNVAFDFTYNGAVVGTGAMGYVNTSGTLTAGTTATATQQFNIAVTNPSVIRFGLYNGGATQVIPNTNSVQFSNIRFLGVLTAEDVVKALSVSPTQSGFYGDTLIKSLINSFVPALGLGVVESVLSLDSNPYIIDHLDASVRRTAYDILQEIAQYYSREWAVWENALLDWKNPNLQLPQWVIPLNKLSSLDLDASVVNSKRAVAVLYTDPFGNTGEQSGASTDRRNPYVLKGRIKDVLVSGGTMTANTAAQLAAIIAQDAGFGPVPAAGSISLPGETVIDHASGRPLKAWEIRAGDNVTLPELPMSDIFTQDGRGEVLFHVISAEAETSQGEVTLTLDSYGSKRSDVLLARLAAVTQLLGG